MTIKNQIVVAALVVSSFYLNAQTNDCKLVSEMPIAFEAMEFRFYKDATEKEEYKVAKEEEEKSVTAARKEIQDKKQSAFKREQTLNSHTKINTVFVPGVAAAASSQTQIDFNNNITCSASTEHSSLNKDELEQIEAIREKVFKEIKTKSGNWIFSVKGKFVNKTDKEYSCKAGDIAKIYVQIPGAEIELVNASGFNVFSHADSKTVEFSNEITATDHKSKLLWCRVEDKLNKGYCRARVEADFPLICREKEYAFHSLESNPITIEVRFGAYKANFPLRVKRVDDEKHDVTIGRALDAVSLFCCQKYSGEFSTKDKVFKIDESKGAVHVFGKPIGVLDQNGYKMILMQHNGAWLSSVSDNVFLAIPNGAEQNKKIVFDEISAWDVYDHADSFSPEVKDCFIRQLAPLSTNSLPARVALGLIYQAKGNEKGMIECFAKSYFAGFENILTPMGYPLFWDMVIKGDTNDVENIIHGGGDKIITTANKEFMKETLLSKIIALDDVAKYKILKEGGVNSVEEFGLNHLFLAAKCGCLGMVRWLVEGAYDKEDVNDADSKGMTPLIYAAKNGSLDVCKYLVDKDANVNYQVNGRDEMGDKRYNNCERTRRFICNVREVRKFAESRWNKSWDGRPEKVTEREIREWASSGVNPDEYLGCHWSIFSWAVELRNDKLVEELLKYGANPNAQYAQTPVKKYTALMLAAEKGNMNLVNMLLGLTTNVGSADERTSRKEAVKAFASGLSIWTYALPEECFSFASQENKTAFCYAVDNKHYDVAMALYRNGGVNESAMLKHESGNCNAFSYAALSITNEAGKPLLDAMFNDPNSRKEDENGMTPLMFASNTGNVLAVRSIRKSFGRDEKNWREYVNQTRSKGLLGRDKKSALDMAGSQEIKTLLQEDLTKQTRE